MSSEARCLKKRKRTASRRSAIREIFKDNLIGLHTEEEEEDVSVSDKDTNNTNWRLVKCHHYQSHHHQTTVSDCESRKKDQVNTKGYYIPIDIVANILSRIISVKPLLRFKCVSKPWYNLITSQPFIQTQLQNQKMMLMNSNYNVNGIHIFVCVSGSDYPEDDGYKTYKLYTLDLMCSTNTIDRQQEVPIVNGLRRLAKPDKLRTIPFGSCNGIICLRNIEGWGFALFNPANHTYLKLPNLKKVVKPLGSLDAFVYGFGYDVASDDYKVVKIVQHSPEPPELPFSHTTVMICSRRNKQWREFQDLTYELSYSDDTHPSIGIYRDNMLHWLAIRKDSPEEDHWRYVILRFDLCNEKFDKVTFSVPVHDMLELNLAEIHGMLLLMAPYRTDEMETDVWIMKEYGVNESWCKLCSLQGIQGFPWPITFSKSRKEILIQDRYKDHSKFVWIDVAAGQVRASHTLPALPLCHSQRSQPYIQSLIALNIDEPGKTGISTRKGIKVTNEEEAIYL